MEVSGTFNNLLDINSFCQRSGALGPEVQDKVKLSCGAQGKRGRFVTVQRTRVEYNIERPFLYVNEIDVYVPPNGMK